MNRERKRTIFTFFYSTTPSLADPVPKCTPQQFLNTEKHPPTPSRSPLPPKTTALHVCPSQPPVYLSQNPTNFHPSKTPTFILHSTLSFSFQSLEMGGRLPAS
uniref:Uncharacterized protein n=1 Tax=Cacopsylla melanoneura TaxID=428564 RepID=A0A8D8YRC6_9HEMI